MFNKSLIGNKLESLNQYYFLILSRNAFLDPCLRHVKFLTNQYISLTNICLKLVYILATTCFLFYTTVVLKKEKQYLTQLLNKNKFLHCFKIHVKITDICEAIEYVHYNSLCITVGQIHYGNTLTVIYRLYLSIPHYMNIER